MKLRIVVTALAAGLLAAAPAAAQQTELKALPGGSLMLKDLPAAQGNAENLPGVRLNMQAQGSRNATNCRDREVNTLGYGYARSETVTECQVGNFSFSTTKSGGGRAPSYHGMPAFSDPFGAPAGPPPGSGGYAPQQSILW